MSNVELLHILNSPHPGVKGRGRRQFCSVRAGEPLAWQDPLCSSSPPFERTGMMDDTLIKKTLLMQVEEDSFSGVGFFS